ncbi:ATP-binding protein [Patescibacteria group bacterium]|nr:ATP-binding protein [Patescibacteria group bacterium]
MDIGKTVNQESKEPIKITMTLPTSAYFMSGIRDFTLSLTKNMTGFSNRWAYRFQSVVDELCNNAIEHGSAAGKEIRITFVSIGDDSIEVYVEDTGTGATKMTAAQMYDMLQERKNPDYIQHLGIRGRGLPKIVAEWTDELEFKDREGGGLVIRVKKKLDAKESARLEAENPEPTHIVLTPSPKLS